MFGVDVELLIRFCLLLLFGWLTATISGAAGFGGALILLPVLTNLLGVKAAVPVLTIAQLWGNGSRVWFGRTEVKWRPVVYFVVTAVPLSIVGSLLFVDLPKRAITMGIGILLIAIVLLRRLGVTQLTFGDQGLLIGGALTGFLSGLAGSAGPLGAVFFLGLGLPATAYVASEPDLSALCADWTSRSRLRIVTWRRHDSRIMDRQKAH